MMHLSMYYCTGNGWSLLLYNYVNEEAHSRAITHIKKGGIKSLAQKEKIHINVQKNVSTK